MDYWLVPSLTCAFLHYGSLWHAALGSIGKYYGRNEVKIYVHRGVYLSPVVFNIVCQNMPFSFYDAESYFVSTMNHLQINL